MKHIVAQELDPSPIWPHTLKYHPVSGALIATGAVPGEEGGHYVAVWTEKTSKPTQCYKRERPCDEGTTLAFACDGKLAAIAAILEAEGDALRWTSTKILPKSAPEQMKNGASGTTANAWADGDDRASFGKKAASKNASSTWNYRSCLDFIEDELEDIACASTNIYDEEDPFFDEDEPTPFERGYGRILAVIRAAKEGEERLREYVRQQAEFLGITGKHARGESNPQPAD